MTFQSPRGDFGFLNGIVVHQFDWAPVDEFQSPRGDFGFLKQNTSSDAGSGANKNSFNPLAGILVF